MVVREDGSEGARVGAEGTLHQRDGLRVAVRHRERGRPRPAAGVGRADGYRILPVDGRRPGGHRAPTRGRE